ncbi:hypothetical protein [Shimazuella kribbensis]|uniref:hypothetical protein n=1 Tax=Shimazuella kribbensis TaxID=139808 RepID=UPI0014710981|nr:hypothetical protein [Shimazuella kribbensis]
MVENQLPESERLIKEGSELLYSVFKQVRKGKVLTDDELEALCKANKKMGMAFVAISSRMQKLRNSNLHLKHFVEQLMDDDNQVSHDTRKSFIALHTRLMELFVHHERDSLGSVDSLADNEPSALCKETGVRRKIYVVLQNGMQQLRSVFFRRKFINRSVSPEVVISELPSSQTDELVEVREPFLPEPERLLIEGRDLLDSVFTQMKQDSILSDKKFKALVRASFRMEKAYDTLAIRRKKLGDSIRHLTDMIKRLENEDKCVSYDAHLSYAHASSGYPN